MELITSKVFGNPQAAKRWRDTEVLIIDEISMISSNTFDLLSFIGKRIRDDFSKPFGGLQVVVCGDFYQLPPVGISSGSGFSNVDLSAISDLEFKKSVESKQKFYCFRSLAWQELFHKQQPNGETFGKVIILDQIFRQKDHLFADMLNEIRRGVCTPETSRVLFLKTKEYEQMKQQKSAETESTEIRPTKLFGTNKEVDVENELQLSRLPDVIEDEHATGENYGESKHYYSQYLSKMSNLLTFCFVLFYFNFR